MVRINLKFPMAVIFKLMANRHISSHLTRLTSFLSQSRGKENIIKIETKISSLGFNWLLGTQLKIRKKINLFFFAFWGQIKTFNYSFVWPVEIKPVSSKKYHKKMFVSTKKKIYKKVWRIVFFNYWNIAFLWNSFTAKTIK